MPNRYKETFETRSHVRIKSDTSPTKSSLKQIFMGGRTDKERYGKDDHWPDESLKNQQSFFNKITFFLAPDGKISNYRVA